jgi:thymidylate synthase
MMLNAEINMIDMRRSYVDLIMNLMRVGTPVRVRGEMTTELLDATLNFSVPYRPMLPLSVGRKINQKLAAVEALSLLAGSAERDLTMAAAPSYAQVLVSQNPNDFYHAAYGPRLGATIDTVVHQLVDDPSTRQAVLTIWRADDLYHTGDKPCTLTIQFLIRNELLHMIVNMRSNDVWLGLAYDAFVFNQLHWTIFSQIRKYHPNLNLGTYRHHAASLHLYDRDREAARRLVIDPVIVLNWELPLGLHCPHNFFPDEVAEILLHAEMADERHPEDLAKIVKLNPWYAKQLTAIEETREVKS